MRIVANKMNNENNFNFILPKHKTPSSTMVSVVDFESEYPGSSPDKLHTFISILQAKFFNVSLTDNRATYVNIDIKIPVKGH